MFEAKPIFHTKNYIEVYPNILIYLQILLNNSILSHTCGILFVFLFIEYVTFDEYMYFFPAKLMFI